MKSYRIMTLITGLTLLTIFTAFALPPGYDRNQIDFGRECGFVFEYDENDFLYYGHSSAKSKIFNPGDGRGERAPADEIWTFDMTTTNQNLFYSASSHPGVNQIKSASDVAIDTTTTPWTYYIADQDPADDPWTHGAVWMAQDLNSDDDIDDPGETTLVTADDAIVSIEGLIYDEDSGVLYASNVGGLTGTPMIFRLEDGNGNDFFESGEITIYFLEPGDFYAGRLCFDRFDPSVIYTVDTSGTIYRLEDMNGDDDCLDAGDATVFTDTLIGGYGIVMDPEGDLFVTASDFSSGAHYLYEINSLGTTRIFDDLTALVGWTAPMVFNNGPVFEPGGPMTALFMSYTDQSFGDPQNVFVYVPNIESLVPSTTPFGLIIILVIASFVLSRRR